MRSGPPVGQPRSAVTAADAFAARTTLELLDRKWVPPVLVVLAGGPRRYAGLARAVGSRISKKVLIDTLRGMEGSRLLTRQVDLDGSELAVRYALTPRGRSLLPIVAGLAHWARTDAARHRRTPPDDGRPGQ